MRSAKGFSLIELLIVVAIILIIAAIAIPNLMKSRMAANEASAVASVRAITTAQEAYQMTYPTLGFSDNLTKLSIPPPGGTIDQNHSGMLDWVLGCNSQPCPKSGYNFSIANANGTPITTYQVTGVPIMLGQTGTRGFCADQTNVIKFDIAGGTNCTQTMQ